jgi:hypothetical protein
MSDPTPGQRWKPGDHGMTRVIVSLHPAGVTYDEGWPSDKVCSFVRWETWADWLLKSGAKCQEETK